MVAFLIRRTFGMILVLIAVSFVTYLIFFKIPGGNPAERIAGRTATPQNIITKLNAAVVKALADPSVQQRFAAQGQDIWPSEQQTPEALAALYKADTEKWWPVIRAQHLRAE